MCKRDIGREILEGVQEINAYKMGKISLKTRELKEPLPPPKYTGQTEFVPSGLCGSDGSEPAHGSRLGAREARTERSGKVVATNC